MLPAEQNYETNNVELLAIVRSFKNWRHYLQRNTYIILRFKNQINLKKFIEPKHPTSRQIRLTLEF